MRYFELRDVNLKDPFMNEFFPRYKDLLFIKIREKATANSLKDKLNNLMNEKQMYKNSSLTLDNISRELATNRTYLSKEINSLFKMGFRDYINKSRVEKAKELMSGANSEGINLLVISEKVGFRNYGTFNTAFKKEFGITPWEWKRKGRLKN